jgi:Tfp pilus assembly protein PilO
MGSSNKLIVSILVVAALAVGFWVLLLSPKREEADELSAEAGQLQVALTEARSRLAVAEEAKRAFPADYRQLVVLGKAVPQGDETSSLLVELSGLAKQSKVDFSSITLEGGGESAESSLPEASASSEGTVPPTEAAASLLPLGASIGPAGLAVVPYTLKFSGSFFHMADFIHGIDSLVHTGKAMTIDGRLVTVDGFALKENPDRGFPYLDASFAVTAFVTPPEQGLTAGATSSEPAPVTTPAGAAEAATATGEETSAATEGTTIR